MMGGRSALWFLLARAPRGVVVLGLLGVLAPASDVFPAGPSLLRETLHPLWRLGGDRPDEGHLFGLVTDLAVDGRGRVLVLDRQLSRLAVFSSEGEFLRHVGREGDGPGELRFPHDLYLSPEGGIRIPLSFSRRVVCFTSAGEYEDSFVVPEATGHLQEIRRAGGHLVAHVVHTTRGRVVTAGEQTEVHAIVALDEDLRETVRYWEASFTSDDAHPIWEERSRALRDRWDVDPAGRVFVATRFDDYQITVYRPDGGVERILRRDYEHRRRRASEKQAVLDWATINPHGNLPGTRFEIEDFDRDILSLHCPGDGTLLVLSSRGLHDRPEGSLGVFDVFSGDGSLLRQVEIRGEGDPGRDRLYFRGDRLYVVTCYRPALAAMVGADPENPWSRACEGPMEALCFRRGDPQPVQDGPRRQP